MIIAKIGFALWLGGIMLGVLPLAVTMLRPGVPLWWYKAFIVGFGLSLLGVIIMGFWALLHLLGAV